MTSSLLNYITVRVCKSHFVGIVKPHSILGVPWSLQSPKGAIILLKFTKYWNPFENELTTSNNISLQYFLAVANLGESDTPTNSSIFKWSKRSHRFILYQLIPSVEARAVEGFTIGQRQFLVIADNRTSYNKPFPGKHHQLYTYLKSTKILLITKVNRALSFSAVWNRFIGNDHGQ